MMRALRDGVSVAETEEGMALLDEDRGEYFTLNPTAAMVVRSLLDGRTAAQATDELTREYAVDRDSAERDVQELVSALEAANLLAPGKP